MRSSGVGSQKNYILQVEIKSEFTDNDQFSDQYIVYGLDWPQTVYCSMTGDL